MKLPLWLLLTVRSETATVLTVTIPSTESFDAGVGTGFNVSAFKLAS